jgi:orotidine-5'-phosphate decarboxylase
MGDRAHPGAERLAVALDVSTIEEADRLCVQVGRAAAFFKVGLELYTAAGPRAARVACRHGRLFLDLKLHDIPETVARAVTEAARMGAELATVHAAGGAEMLGRAVAAAKPSGLRILAVTVLTSMDAADLAATGVAGSPEAVVLARARLAAQAGCAGVVASPAEAGLLRAALPRPFLIVTPGVRPAGAAAGDQKRVATPTRAIQDGADLVVVGRPIRDAADPGAAARAIVAELEAAEAAR